MSLNKNSTGISLLSKEKSKGNTKEDYVVALAGNPNVGKSTVFNALTGLNQHTGNWPGKTVAKAEGYYEFKDSTIKIVDLPGTYSLLSNSEEEEIARDYICFNDPDIVVVVADATSLERNLNLFIQISEITEKAILCVNLTDEAEKNNIKIDLDLLSKELNANLVSSSARNGVGIEELKEAIFKEITLKDSKKNAINYDSPIEKAIEEVKEKGYGVVMPSVEDMSLEDPQIVKQGSKFGVKLKASAPSLHIMSVDIETEVNPIVGSQAQSEELVKYLLDEFEQNPKAIWDTNMFGKSLSSLVNEGINSKITTMPVEAQRKMRKTLGRIINEGKGGIICILL